MEISYEALAAGRIKVTTDGGDRWAIMVTRDWQARRHPSYEVILSDGRRMGGEVSYPFVVNYACRFVTGRA